MVGAEGWKRDLRAQLLLSPHQGGVLSLLYPGTRGKLVLFLALVSSLRIQAYLGHKLQGPCEDSLCSFIEF